MAKVPCLLRTINRVPTLLAPSLPWGLDTMGAFTEAKGWHEAPEEATGKGRACTPEEAARLLEAAQSTIGAAASLTPQARAGASTHEARKAKAKELSSDET